MSTEVSSAGEKKTPLVVVYAGGGGANNAETAMKKCNPNDNPHETFLVVNTDWNQLDARFVRRDVNEEKIREKLTGQHFAEEQIKEEIRRQKNFQLWMERLGNQLHILKIGTSGDGAGGKPEVAAEAARTSLGRIVEHLEGKKAVELVTCLGGGTGSGATPVIAKAAMDAGAKPHAIVTMPRVREGGKRRLRATEAKNKLLEICPTTVLYNQYHPDANCTFQEMFDSINESCVLNFLMMLREIIQEVGLVNRDLNDREKVLEAGNHVLLGFSNIKKHGDNFQAAVKELLENPYQDLRIWGGAREYFLWLHGTGWTVSKSDDLIGEIETKMGQSLEKNVDAEVNQGVHQHVSDDEMWAGLIVVAKEPPADEPPLRLEAATSVSVSIPTGIAAPAEMLKIEAPAAVESDAEKARKAIAALQAQTVEETQNGNGHGKVNGKANGDSKIPVMLFLNLKDESGAIKLTEREFKLPEDLADRYKAIFRAKQSIPLAESETLLNDLETYLGGTRPVWPPKVPILGRR